MDYFEKSRLLDRLAEVKKQAEHLSTVMPSVGDLIQELSAIATEMVELDPTDYYED